MRDLLSPMVFDVAGAIVDAIDVVAQLRKAVDALTLLHSHISLLLLLFFRGDVVCIPQIFAPKTGLSYTGLLVAMGIHSSVKVRRGMLQHFLLESGLVSSGFSILIALLLVLSGILLLHNLTLITFLIVVLLPNQHLVFLFFFSLPP